ncbi:MAG TPA: hypothetical protein VJ808_06240 [Gemmatimonadales bacterium]|nr:hypothetical protein [Gemmatimonadales bacterium]
MKARMLSLVLGFCVASASQAQDACIEQLEFPEVGRWAEYKAMFKTDPYTMRYAVIGSENRDGKDLKWLELSMVGSKKDQNMVYQMLVPGSAAQLGDVHEVVMKAGANPAMKINGPMLNMIRGQMKKQSFLTDACKDVTLVGEESITVPAGKFRSRHFHSSKYSSDSWLSAGVPFSMIKTTGKDFQMELAAHGAGAKSSILETPQSMGGK